MKTYLDVIEFAISEIARFAKLKPGELKGVPWEDVLSTIRAPNGRVGSLILGSEAQNEIQSMAELAVSRSCHRGRIDSSAVAKEIKDLIVERFFNEKREVNTQQVAKVVSSAVKKVSKSKVNQTHIFPFHLGYLGTAVQFKIGPVTFKQTEQVLEQLKPAFEEYINAGDVSISKDKETNRNLRIELSEIARGHYGPFGWVAEVQVNDFDEPTSKNHAKRLVDSALDCLHLLVGAAYSNHMRVGGPSIHVNRSSQIVLDKNGALSLSALVDWESHNLGDDWWDHVNSDGRKKFIALMGVAIENGVNALKPMPLARRFLDAAAWYGEAVRDEFPASRLVKYVIAIERIVATSKNEENLSDTLKARGAALLHRRGCDDLEKFKKSIGEIYNLRSRLVHGSYSPTTEKLGAKLRQAEELSRFILLHSLHFFKEKGLQEAKVTPSNIQENFQEIVEWSEEF